MRSRSILPAVAVALVACGPDARPQESCTSKPDFVLTVTAHDGFLPEDSVVSVKFGGDGHESYRPNGHNERQVLFCDAVRKASDSAGGAGGVTSSEEHAFAGAGGASDAAEATIRAITCEMWTGGPASVTVQAGAWQASQTLTPKDDACTVWNAISLGSESDP